MKRIKKTLKMILAVALILAFRPGVGFAEGVTSFDISDGDITIEKGTAADTLKVSYGDNLTSEFEKTQEITIIGTSTSGAITVNEGVEANITLSGVNIDVSAIDNKSAFGITVSGSKVNLTIDGVNTLKSGIRSAGLEMRGNSELTIGGEGELIATGGQFAAGIGGGLDGELSGTVKITGGRVTATGGDGSTGIGEGKNGTVSGTVEIEGELVVSEEGKKFAIEEGVVLTKDYDGERFKPTYSIPNIQTTTYSYQRRDGGDYIYILQTRLKV